MTGPGTRTRRTAVFSVALCAFGATFAPAYADGSVRALGMGRGAPNAAEFARYDAVVAQYNASGERFRIDQNCRSACTMFLGIRNVCVSPGATLSFHAGHTAVYTQRMLSTYNSALRQYVTENHFLDTSAFHSISGRELISRFGYKGC
jgi:hypothetical protein